MKPSVRVEVNTNCSRGAAPATLEKKSCSMSQAVMAPLVEPDEERELDTAEASSGGGGGRRRNASQASTTSMCLAWLLAALPKRCRSWEKKARSAVASARFTADWERWWPPATRGVLGSLCFMPSAKASAKRSAPRVPVLQLCGGREVTVV